MGHMKQIESRAKSRTKAHVVDRAVQACSNPTFGLSPLGTFLGSGPKGDKLQILNILNQ